MLSICPTRSPETPHLCLPRFWELVEYEFETAENLTDCLRQCNPDAVVDDAKRSNLAINRGCNAAGYEAGRTT